MVTKTKPSHIFARTSVAAAVSAACAGITSTAVAQDDADTGLHIEEIIVTATKRVASIQDVPMSVSVLTDEDIVREGFKQLDDYIGRIPSLASGRREPGGSNVIMRGCAVSGIAFSDNPTTAVYLDEQPITVAGFNPDPRLVDIQRVEALSGPQGSLFGDASQCGTLRIITNKPDTTAFGAWVDLTGTSVSHGDFGSDYSAMVNIPLHDNKAALRLVGFYTDEAGYIDNVPGTSPGGQFDNAQFAESDTNSGTVAGGRIGLRILPNDDWTIDLQGIVQNTESDGFGDTDLTENFLTDTALGKWQQLRFGNDLWKDQWYQLALTLEGSLGWADLTLATSFMNRKTRYDADSTAYMAAFQARVYGYYDIYNFGGDPQAMAFDVTDTDRYSIELRLATAADSDSRWSGLVGVFYNRVENHAHFAANVRQLAEPGNRAFYYLNYTEFYDHAPTPPTTNWWNGVYNSTLEQVAVFGEATFDFNDRFSLTAGGRWFNIQTDRTLENGTLVPNADFTQRPPELNCDPSPTAPPETVARCYTGVRNLANSDESDFVPKVTATYHVTDDQMLYFTYSEGFRRGGGNAARPTSVFGQSPFNQFDSDTVKNYEIGAKTTFFDGRFQFNITGYHMIWDNIQIEAEDPQTNIFTLSIINFPEAELNGIEAFFNLVPVEGMSITANVGYSDAALSKTAVLFPGSDGEKIAASGEQLPLMPDWKGSLAVDYYFQQEILGGLTPSVHLAYTYTGDSLNSLKGIQSIEFDNPVRNQPSYSLTNLRFGLETDSWSAAIYVDNVFDKYAQQFFNDRWAQTRLTVNQPRSVGITYRKNFR